MIKWPILQEDMATLNMDAADNRTSKHMRQKLIGLKEYINMSNIIVGDFNISLLLADQAGRK